MKTVGRLDPERDPDDDPGQGDGTTTAGTLETRWIIDREIRARARENTDLLTPHTVTTMQHAWQAHLRAHDEAVGLHAEEKARPHQERVAEHRADALAKAYPNRSQRRIIPPSPSSEETEPPF